MRLSNLKLKNFRNYHETKLEFSPNINVLIGENAQGKTNLLESRIDRVFRKKCFS